MRDGVIRPPLRLGVIGFGRLAQNYYVPALRRMRGEATAVAIADPNLGCRTAANALLPDAGVYDDARAMLDAAAIDAVLVASPPSAHLVALRLLADRPALPAFVEKPLLSPAESADLVPADVRPRVMVNFNRRFWPRYRAIADAMRAGRLGKVQAVGIELRVNVERWLSVTQHRVEPGHGGALYDLGSHAIDLAGFLVGARPDAVRAVAHTRRWEHDHVMLTLTFANGVEATCRAAYEPTTRERVVVTGDAGRAFIDDPNRGVHFGHASAATRLSDLFTFAGHAARRYTSMSRSTIELALRSFVDCVRDGRPFEIGFDDGAFNAAALRAAARSIQSGRAEPIQGDE